MKKLTVLTVSQEKYPPLHLELADSFWERFRGLMLRERLPEGTGLYIVPCNSIHMLFMRFSIDAVFLDKEGKIVKLARSLPPWIGMSIALGAEGVLELPVGTIERYQWKVGDGLMLAEE